MHFEGKQASRWYRTGDLASHDAQAGLLYGGRIDNQVKMRGYRVDVQEVEAVIRRLGGSDLVAVVPKACLWLWLYRIINGHPQGMYSAIAGLDGSAGFDRAT